MTQKKSPRKADRSQFVGKRNDRKASDRSRTVNARTNDARSSGFASNANRPVAGLGGEQVEGRQAVRELLLAKKRRVRDVWISDVVTESDVIEEIIQLCSRAHVQIHHVPKSRLDSASKSDAPQGVLAHASPLIEAELSALCKATKNVKPFLVAFDGITDPHNFGSILRSAECFGATGAIVTKHRSAHVTPTVAKASAGAIEHIPIAVVPGIAQALKSCKDAGLWTIGLDPDGETNIDRVEVSDQPVVIVLGAEGAGLSRLTKDRCDVLATIPQFGAIASLNVAAAGAIACFAIASRRS